MVQIAPHHSPKHPLSSDTSFKPLKDWGDDVYVQWGGPRLDLAFFEAFLDDNGLIRGEGPSIADAEAQAYEKYLAARGCDHLWARDKWTNGFGICRRCGHKASQRFRPITELGECFKPLEFHALEFIKGGGLWRFEDEARPPKPGHLRRYAIKARRMGILLPDPPSLPSNEDEFIRQVPVRYNNLCVEAIAAWLHTGEVHLVDTYVKIMRRQIHWARDHAARVWKKPELRDKTRFADHVPAANSRVEEDAEGLLIKLDGRTYRPLSEGDNDGLHDRGHGGLLAGDPICALPSGDSTQIVLPLPDGRRIQWTVQ